MSASRNSQPFKWSIPLGKVAGIRIMVHVSFFLLVVLFAVAESRPGGLGITNGLLWLAVVFGCVLLHELAHSIVAVSKGLVVKSIVLLPIGGISQIEKMPEAWKDELEISAAGPITSLLLAVLAAVAALASGESLLPVNIYGGALLPRLAWLNLLLGLFNLLPAFPLDGGRVLRALLERRGDPGQATRTAAQIGRWLGIAMVVVGVVWNLWLIIIGVVVYLAATQEEAAAAVHERLRGRTVRQFMRSPVVTVDARQPLAILAGWWRGPQVVTLDGRYFGMIDTSTLNPAGSQVLVGDVADRNVPVLGPDDDLGRSALDVVLNSGYRVLPVAEDGRVVGVLVLDDVGSWLARAA